jgi:hypothetical protein
MNDAPFSHPSRFHHRGFSPFAQLKWAIFASLMGGLAWICFTLLYVAFWAHGFSLFQSVIVIVVSLLILCGLLTASWISFGLGFARRWDD